MLYLLCKQLLQAAASFVMNLLVEGSSLDEPTGFSAVSVDVILLVTGIVSIILPIFWLLRTTRLETEDLRLTRPPQWSPLFCIQMELTHCKNQGLGLT